MNAQIARLRKMQGDPEQAKNLSSGVVQVLQALGVGAAPDAKQYIVLSHAFEPGQAEELEAHRKTLDELNRNNPPTPEFAMAMNDDPHPHDGHVFKRGNPGTPGPEAPRRFLLALSKPGVERAHWTKRQRQTRVSWIDRLEGESPSPPGFLLTGFGRTILVSGIVREPPRISAIKAHPPTKSRTSRLSQLRPSWSTTGRSRICSGSWSLQQRTGSLQMLRMQLSKRDPDNRYLSRMNRHRSWTWRRCEIRSWQPQGRLDEDHVGGKSVEPLVAAVYQSAGRCTGLLSAQNLPGIFRNSFDFRLTRLHKRTTIPDHRFHSRPCSS